MSNRFAIACAMLRHGRHLDKRMPAQRSGESLIDYLVRFGLAPNPQVAAEMLALGAGITGLLDEVINIHLPAKSGQAARDPAAER